jgi:hypothetical protein
MKTIVGSVSAADFGAGGLAMNTRVRTILAALLIAALTDIAAAQFPPPPPARSPAVQDRWPDLPNAPAEQLRPQADPARPQAQRPVRRPAEPQLEQDLAEPKPRPRAPAAPPNVVACDGVFAKDSAHLKLAIKYDSRNITYGQVDGPEGTKLNASIIYPNDPRRRLEVLWNNEASRSDTQIIAINGRSQWVAPRGLKLGMPIAAIEKANGRPFKLSKFGPDGGASVLGWEGGALGTLPGGCKVGLRLVADANTPPDVRSALSGDKELLSNDASVRAAKPTVVEVLIGY